MSSSGQVVASDGKVLSWPKRLLSADDLRLHLHGQRELVLLPRTIVTPLAADELRARGIRVTWQSVMTAPPAAASPATWGYVEEKQDPLVAAALRALERDGITIPALGPGPIREVLRRVAGGQPSGAIVFSASPALVCCIANKHAGLRAAAVLGPAQVGRLRMGLAPNFYAIEMPGRTYFELRQILRMIAATPPGPCPAELAATLKELDSHAHR